VVLAKTEENNQWARVATFGERGLDVLFKNRYAYSAKHRTTVQFRDLQNLTGQAK